VEEAKQRALTVFILQEREEEGNKLLNRVVFAEYRS
jgi:hypothetical protein